MLNQKNPDARGFYPPNIFRYTLIYKLSIVAAAVYFISTFFYYVAFESSKTADISTNEALELVSKDIRYTEIFRKTSRYDKNIKYVLLWTPSDYPPFIYPEGQRGFLDHNCSHTNCYITSNRTFLDDVTMFDAIAFNGREIERGMQLPNSRSLHQKYIFFNMESAEYYPVCSKKFDGYFNWTVTHRLDSDIPWPYILILDKQGNQIGPKKNINWVKNTTEPDNIRINLKNKNKAAAWFVSNCYSKSRREDFVQNLQKALRTYNLQVDVYGSCGDFSCPRNQNKMCNAMLKESYYFYLSLENSFSEDYVTEKLMTALENDVVPIVYGAADYTRFLPPGSYINGRDYKSMELAKLMYQLIKSPKQYLNYFKWRHHYKYIHGPNMCSLCAALNNRTKFETKSVIKNFRGWWQPYYKDIC